MGDIRHVGLIPKSGRVPRRRKGQPTPVFLLHLTKSVYLKKMLRDHTLGLGEGHGNRLQSSCLENPMDRGAWRAIVQETAESWTWLKCLGTRRAPSNSLEECGRYSRWFSEPLSQPLFHLFPLGITFLHQSHLLLYILCFNHKEQFWACLCVFVYLVLSEPNDLSPRPHQADSPVSIQRETSLHQKAWRLITLFPCPEIIYWDVSLFFVLAALGSSNKWDKPVSSPLQDGNWDFLFQILAPRLHGSGVTEDKQPWHPNTHTFTHTVLNLF